MVWEQRRETKNASWKEWHREENTEGIRTITVPNKQEGLKKLSFKVFSRDHDFKVMVWIIELHPDFYH